MPPRNTFTASPSVQATVLLAYSVAASWAEIQAWGLPETSS
jgi:hypothetical protein